MTRAWLLVVLSVEKTDRSVLPDIPVKWQKKKEFRIVSLLFSLHVYLSNLFSVLFPYCDTSLMWSLFVLLYSGNKIWKKKTRSVRDFPAARTVFIISVWNTFRPTNIVANAAFSVSTRKF
jgi:hypothetical protein